MLTSMLTKSVFQFRSHLVSSTCNFKFSVENALGKTRQLLRFFYDWKSQLSSETLRSQHILPLEYFQSSRLALTSKAKFILYRPGFLHNVTSKWVADSIVGTVNKETRRKLQQRGVGICFVGFALAKKPSLMTDEEEFEGVSYLIRDSFSAVPWQSSGLNTDSNYRNQKAFDLKDLKFGDFIAKGCNASVYSAHIQHTDSDSIENEIFAKPPVIKNMQLPVGNFGAYNLAVKIMFNYGVDSNAFAIWNAMHKEALPSISGFSLNILGKHKVRKKKLKPHPNVVEMYFAFADELPLLPGAYNNYPQALPERLLNDGCGRNMTLFLVMKRYHCSLKDYLRSYHPTSKVSLLLFTQLMEALVHLHQNSIAHRDLKTDNLLIDLSQGISFPKLAVTDFGCCSENLLLNYTSSDISKGGNMTLMAPEVWNVKTGSVIDYSRSDLWTAGTIAYEIFGGTNPFYSTTASLRSSSYNEEDLPTLPAQTPAVVQRLVMEILHIDPKKRPQQNFVATVCQILLHAPPEMLHGSYNKEVCKKCLEWIFRVFAKTYLEGTVRRSRYSLIEFELRHTFCSRIQYLEVNQALKYILN